MSMYDRDWYRESYKEQEKKSRSANISGSTSTGAKPILFILFFAIGRYCFFNVDGLLNRSSDWKKPFTINYGLVNFFCHFLSQNNLIPILTSSWRIGFNGP